MITLQLSQKWHVRTPAVYRYMEKEYVDRFFATGELRLSSFTRFKQHKDEARGDPAEGHNVISVRGSNGVLIGAALHGVNAYVLCTSTNLSDLLMKDFNVDSSFKILDTTQFGIAIASSIPSVGESLEGPCDYMEEFHSIRREVDLIPEELLEAGTEPPPNGIAEYLMHAAGADVFFSKRTKFEHQREYRFVWLAPNAVPDYLTIHCPEAIQYCERCGPRFPG